MTERVLIAIMGPTGSGKSSFISTLAPEAAGSIIGHGLESCTSEVKLYDARVGDKLVTFIDTPGFDDTYNSDTQVLRLIANHLEAAYQSKTLLNAIIYFHRITDNRVGGVAAKNMRAFRKLCGDDGLKNVVLCTTMWDIAKPGDGERREEQLRTDFWKNMIANGSTVVRHDSSVESALNIVRPLLGNTTFTSQLQRELAQGMKLTETGVGGAINEDLVRLQQEHRSEMEVLRQEMRSAHGEDLRQAREDYNQEKMRLQDLIHQQEAMFRERAAEVGQLKQQLQQRRKKC